ncbi:MAG: glycosyl hydrolase [Clostridiales bacterium 43-6]|nr:MAG: glycosyl hydrolase [Clostridiales bacterium 43-6]
MEEWIKEAYDKSIEKVTRTSKRIGDSFPHVSINGTYDSENPYWWTNGFWPGLLWLVYHETKDESLKRIAESCEKKLDERLHDFYSLDHDVGFLWMPSSISNYKTTGNETSRRRAMIAASHLAGRFNIAGRFIRAWEHSGEIPTGWAIIDCMMNLPLLYWASEITQDPRFKHIAVAHALTAMDRFIREDGSTNHIVCFDPETGEHIGERGGQGYSPTSAWSRGNSWAIYGMALSARYTGKAEFLQAAKKTAAFFIKNLEDDFVPFWDFRAPVEDPMPRDTSAAACAACGLLEIAELVSDGEKDFYITTAKNIVKSLYENYGAWDEDEEALIIGGTVHRPADSNVNVPIIYGDYFFFEALYRFMGNKDLLW